MSLSIRLKHSATRDKAPLPTDLSDGELALNTNVDSPAAYLKDSSGSIVKLAGVGSVATPDASETVKGIVELATAAETTAGTNNTRAVHPAGLKVELDKCTKTTGGVMTGSVTVPERTITAGAFDLATGPYWTCGAISIPAPTNAVVGMSGLIRLTALPTGWDAVFRHAGGAVPAPAAFPAIVPFYVSSPTEILVGAATEFA